MDIAQEIMDVTTASGTMAVLHTRAPSGSAIGRVGIFFDAPGIRDATHSFSKRLAAEGFDVVVPDLYNRHERLFHGTPSMVAADPTLRPRMRELMGTLDDDEIQQDMADAMAAAGWAGAPAACIGFCLGARGVHRAMTQNPDVFIAGSMFHPSFLVNDTDTSPHLSVGSISGPLHIGIGTEDKVQSIEMNQPYFDAAADMSNIEVKIFDGADHGFTWPEYDATYHEQASTTCFGETVTSFRNAF